MLHMSGLRKCKHSTPTWLKPGTSWSRSQVLTMHEASHGKLYFGYWKSQMDRWRGGVGWKREKRWKNNPRKNRNWWMVESSCNKRKRNIRRIEVFSFLFDCVCCVYLEQKWFWQNIWNHFVLYSFQIAFFFIIFVLLCRSHGGHNFFKCIWNHFVSYVKPIYWVAPDLFVRGWAEK